MSCGGALRQRPRRGLVRSSARIDWLSGQVSIQARISLAARLGGRLLQQRAGIISLTTFPARRRGTAPRSGRRGPRGDGGPSFRLWPVVVDDPPRCFRTPCFRPRSSACRRCCPRPSPRRRRARSCARSACPAFSRGRRRICPARADANSVWRHAEPHGARREVDGCVGHTYGARGIRLRALVAAKRSPRRVLARSVCRAGYWIAWKTGSRAASRSTLSCGPPARRE